MADDEKKNEQDDEQKLKEELKKKKKAETTRRLIRIVTVIAYIAGVSGAGFLMSLYYLIFWDPQIKAVKPPQYLKSSEGNYIFMGDKYHSSRTRRSMDSMDSYEEEDIENLRTLLKMIQNNSINTNEIMNYFDQISSKNVTDNRDKTGVRKTFRINGLTNEIGQLMEKSSAGAKSWSSVNDIPSYNYETLLNEEEAVSDKEYQLERENNFIPLGNRNGVESLSLPESSLKKLRKRNQLEGDRQTRTHRRSTVPMRQQRQAD